MQSLLETGFAQLLRASWQGAILILLVLAAQRVLGRRLEPQWRHALWLLVLARLALPWTLPSPISLFNLVSLMTASRPAENPVVLREETRENMAGPSVAVRPVLSPSPLVASAKHWPRDYRSLLPLLWGVGALGLSLHLGAAHYRFHRKVMRERALVDEQALTLLEQCKAAMRLRTPVTLVETTAVDGPSLFGFLRPRLLLPAGFTRNFSPEELRFVFLHELGHVKRHDIPIGWVMALLQVLHWFNPLVWLAFSRTRVDRELACDAVALAHAEEREAKPYGRTILKLLESFGTSRHAPGLAGIVEDKQEMQQRILMITQFNKPRRRFGLAGMLFIGLALVALTDAQLGCKSTSASKESGTASLTPQEQQHVKLAAPRIISTVPAIGATEVDPAISEITVTFDQDMGGGFSWTGGGPEYPPGIEGRRPEWRQKRTCALPVKLEPGHFYRVGINSTSYRNFASEAGVPAMPSAIFFTTKGADEQLKAKTLTPRVVRLEPDNGAQNVSPEIEEVRVTFNVPMGGGFSWCTAGDDDSDFPKGREGKRAHWTEDKKCCVLPVTLKPGMTYRLSLNAEGYKNFQSVGGVPLEPVAYTFTTSGKP
ncbi:MAG TPA: M56 family metallopeptidase [Verrucomicrobiae bacterium]|nr:M56 family metallopeptidase [Verrucomicrobiae bacterium]